MIRIVLAEDHILIRQALRVLLDMESDLSVVGEASDGNEVIPIVQQLKPDILMLDLKMPTVNGLDILRELSAMHPTTKVIVLTMYSDLSHIADALRSGAMGYVPKSAQSYQLVEAIRTVAGGTRYLDPAVSNQLIDSYIDVPSEVPPGDRLKDLTEREREVLRWVAKGYTNARIASRLGISRRTVEAHRANLMRKLGLHTQADLLHFALKPLD